MAYKIISDLDLQGKKVFMRVDFNVPLNKATGTEITSDTRIRAALPSIQLALDNGAALVLASHLGRPDGKRVATMSLKPVAARLSELLGRPVTMANDCVGPEVEALAAALRPGDVLLLENLRYHAEEEANDAAFSKQLAALADVYVNDAFGTAHRAHASTAGIVPFLSECAAGLLMDKELTWLSKATAAPEHPYVAIVGGAKISGKIDVVDNFLRLADKVLIGGAMAYTFFKAQGKEVGGSLVEDEKIELAKETMANAGGKLMLPVDHVIASSFSAAAETATLGVDEPVPAGWMGLDIGPKTIAAYAEQIAGAKLIVWNGPMGVFELEPFANGTLSVGRAVADSAAVSIVGGGDSEKAIKKAGIGANISHVSTGGGASLEFLSGLKLPGVEALGGI
jgi:phosphoglycerate kinase